MSIRPLDMGFREDVDRRARAILYVALVLGVVGALASRLPFAHSVRSWLIAPVKPGIMITGAVRSALVASLTGAPAEASVSTGQDRVNLLAAEARIEQLESELNELRAANDLPSATPFTGELASVTGRITGMGQNILLLDKGTSVGIRPGSIVLAACGDRVAVAGRVVEAGPNMAKVVTILDPSARIPARLATSGGFVYTGVAGNPRGRLEYVPRDLGVAVGDEIATSEDGTIFPEGLLIGRVSRLGATGSVFHEIHIEPAVAIDRVHYVWVARKGRELR